jgi:hypothetical protein
MQLRLLIFLFLIFGIDMATALAQSPAWPALPKTGFIAGRPATQKDVAEGNAVFSADKDGKVIGTPLPVKIPQYALWDDGKGHKVPVIVVQAESANGFEIFGFRNASGKFFACTRAELTLLGQTHP